MVLSRGLLQQVEYPGSLRDSREELGDSDQGVGCTEWISKSRAVDNELLEMIDETLERDDGPRSRRQCHYVFHEHNPGCDDGSREKAP